MSKKKMDAKAFAAQKRNRRRMLTFMRMVRYGINNFSRNAWLTIAATAVMTITLLIIFTTIAARNVLADTITTLQSKVDMSIYVKHDIGGEAVTSLESDLAKLPGVKSVNYVSPDEGRKNLAQQNSADVDVLNAINEATLNLPGVFNVKVDDINNTSQLDKFVKTNQTYLDNKDPSHEPSFAGKRRQSIQNIGRALSFAEKVGIIVSIIFVIISSLIVFNTIRMAIFSRKEEIQMMKLIGADKAFIRGPFIVEAVVYGFIAAILATGLGIGMLMASQDKLSSYEIAVTPTINWIILYIGFVVAGMILAGALIGVISSLLATRKYLRIE